MTPSKQRPENSAKPTRRQRSTVLYDLGTLPRIPSQESPPANQAGAEGHVEAGGWDRETTSI